VGFSNIGEMVTSKLSFIAPFIILVLALLVVVSGNCQAIHAQEGNYETYNNDELGISFIYPSFLD
jgi:hypothetical protein